MSKFKSILLEKLSAMRNFYLKCMVAIFKTINILIIIASISWIAFYYISIDDISNKYIKSGQRVVYDMSAHQFMLGSDPKNLGKVPNELMIPVTKRTNSETTQDNLENKSNTSSEEINKPFNKEAANKKAKIAILVANLGLSESNTKLALNMPNWISVGISPYAANIASWEDTFYKKGHEIYTDLPMESLDDQKFDYGNLSMLSYSTDEQNIKNYEAISSKFKKSKGFYFIGQEQFTKSDKAPAIFEMLKRSNMTFIYASESTENKATINMIRSIGVKYITNPIVIDNDLSNFIINSKLKELMDKAVKNGVAFGVTRPYPITLNALLSWIEENKDNTSIEFVKISDIIDYK